MGCYYCHHCDHYRESHDGCYEDPNDGPKDFNLICEECHMNYEDEQAEQRAQQDLENARDQEADRKVQEAMDQRTEAQQECRSVLLDLKGEKATLEYFQGGLPTLKGRYVGPQDEQIHGRFYFNGYGGYDHYFVNEVNGHLVVFETNAIVGYVRCTP